MARKIIIDIKPKNPILRKTGQSVTLAKKSLAQILATKMSACGIITFFGTIAYKLLILLSVLMSVKDDAKNLPRAINSILTQTYEDFELPSGSSNSNDITITKKDIIN